MSAKLPRHTVFNVVETSAPLRHLHLFVWQARCVRARAAEADYHVRSIQCVQRVRFGKEFDQRNAVLPFHMLHYFVNKNGWRTCRPPLQHLWTKLKQDMHQQQIALTKRIGHELLNHVFEKMFGKHPCAKFPQCGLCFVHCGDYWSIEMRLEANNVTTSARNSVRSDVFGKVFAHVSQGLILFGATGCSVGEVQSSQEES